MDERPLEDALVEGAFHSADPNAMFAVVLHLSYLRSQARVAQALMTRFPTEEAWQAALRDRLFIETIQDLSDIVADLRSGAFLSGGFSPEHLAESAAQHHGRALEAVADLATQLAVDPNDLLTVLIRT